MVSREKVEERFMYLTLFQINSFILYLLEVGVGVGVGVKVGEGVGLGVGVGGGVGIIF